MAAPVQPNPDAPSAAPPVIPPASAQLAPAVDGGVAQAAQAAEAAPVQQEEVCSRLVVSSPILPAFLVTPSFPSR